MENHLRAMLDKGLPTVATRIESAWATIAEMASATGIFDYLEFVAEYAPYEQADLENLARAMELHHTGSIIKVDLQNRAYVAQKALASGFQGVLFTDHKTPEEVRESIRMIRPNTPEDGGIFGCPSRRFVGCLTGVPQMDYAAMLRQAVVAVMIEKKEAMDHIEEICSIPGVDMVQFGPSDYSMSLGLNFKEHEAEIRAVEAEMIRVALRHGVRPRCEINRPEEALRYMEMGVKDFCIGDELRNHMTMWTQMGGGLRKLLEERA